MSKIPKIIHYVWLGRGEKPKMFYRCLESWKKFCPDYEIKEWNEDNCDFQKSIYATQSYSKKKYGFTPDYIRAKVLNEYGGIYLDTDVEIVKSFDDLLDNEFVIGLENNVHCGTATLMSTPHHPFTELMCEFYKVKPYILPNGKIDFTPSTPIWTYFLNKYYDMKLKNIKQVLTSKFGDNYKTVTILPKDYFSPINYTTRKLKQTDNTHSIHYFNATWFTKKMKTREKFLRAIYYIFTPCLFDCFTRMYVKSVFSDLKNFEKSTNFASKIFVENNNYNNQKIIVNN